LDVLQVIQARAKVGCRTGTWPVAEANGTEEEHDHNNQPNKVYDAVHDVVSASTFRFLDCAHFELNHKSITLSVQPSFPDIRLALTISAAKPASLREGT